MIAIVDYGIGNLFSIYNGLKHVHAQPLLVTPNKVERLKDAAGIIVPGVGAFDDCARSFRSVAAILIECIESGMPVLGICVGMQLLFEASEEGSETGLGLIPGRVVRLPKTVRVPHMGWNNLTIPRPTPLLEGITEHDYFYFVHSYHCVPRDAARVMASVEYGGALAAVVQRDKLFGVQFHPEKSSEKGLHILHNFAAIAHGT